MFSVIQISKLISNDSVNERIRLLTTVEIKLVVMFSNTDLVNKRNAHK